MSSGTTSTIVHFGDCGGTWCSYCGCCQHGPAQDGLGCRADDAPMGMECPEADCGCEGNNSYSAPTAPDDIPAGGDAEPGDIQLHQKETLFDLVDGLQSA